MDSKDDYHVKDNIFHGRDTKPLFDIKSERHLSSQWMRAFISRQYRSVKHHMKKTSRYTKKKVSKSDVFVKKKENNWHRTEPKSLLGIKSYTFEQSVFE